jgi:hypothetical protein
MIIKRLPRRQALKPTRICHSAVRIAFGLFVLACALPASTNFALELAGLSVTPHCHSPELRYRRPPDPQLGARVELFLRNEGNAALLLGPDFPANFDGRRPMELLASGDWAWHDSPSARSNLYVTLAPGALTVWAFNSRGANWGANTAHQLEVGGVVEKPITLQLDAPRAWLSAVTFLGRSDSVTPSRAIVHVANESGLALTLRACRLWLPTNKADFLALRPQTWQRDLDFFPQSGVIPTGEKGGFSMETGPLPLTYCAVEVQTLGLDGKPASLWAHLRIKREAFDLSGGWVASGLGGSNTLRAEPYLKTLRRMHINAGMHQEVPGYTDNAALYAKYPLKYMNRLQPLDQYDTDAMLPRIHAVEFLGEPQYGGGRPVPPQDVFSAFLPYGPTRLPTSVTHSEERVWRYYAGLSDYPHYDAYRVTAPAPDSWGLYDRWNGERIRWGAPLETIGDMTRSLRDLNRPRPIAYWSQGAHAGWDRYGGRARTSPTPDELRAQAYHALGQRITSLYWFNLSLKSIVKFRDLIEPITRVNREIRLMEELLIEGDAFEYRRELREAQPSWDLASVTGPKGALFFVLDLAYSADPQEKVFQFKPREGVFVFRLPAYLSGPAEVFRLDADGTRNVEFQLQDGRLVIRDRVTVTGIYLAAPKTGFRERLQARHAELIGFERSFGFDPAASDSDFETLQKLLPSN